MFSSAKSKTREAAQRLISGHVALLAYWALKHAGVLDAMTRDPAAATGLDVREFAREARLSPEVLEALLAYLASADLVALRDGRALLTLEGRALLEHENGVLELIASYQGVLDIVEHFLVRLKIPGTVAATRRSDSAALAQHQRWLGEVYPALAERVVKQKFTHLLDLACGAADLLIHLARVSTQIVGVGVANDGSLVRKANAAISAAGLEKRFIAVTANPLEVLTETKRVFDRIGISQQLWHEIDCILACNVLGEATALDRAAIVKALAALPRNFPHSRLLLAEPCAGAKFDKNYYAPELALLLQLSRSTLWTAEQWRSVLAAAKLTVRAETSFITDGLTVFLCSW